MPLEVSVRAHVLFIGVSLLFLAFWPPSTGRAATFDQPAFDALLHGSGFIFEGQVVEVDPGLSASSDPATRIILRVTDVYAGKAAAVGERFSFELPEGDLPDGRVVEIVEAPRFRLGGHYLVFYTRRVWHLTPIVGWSHGLWQHVHGAQGEVWVDGMGRCAAELDRRGIVPGPRVAERAGHGEVKTSGHRVSPPVAGPTSCLPIQALRAKLRARVAELGLRGGADVQRASAGARWTLSPAVKGAP